MPCRALDRREHTPFTWRHEKNGFTRASRPTRSADTMNIGFGVVRNIVVNDMTDSIDIKPTSGNVRRDQYVQCTFLQALDHLLPMRLRHVAIHSGGAVAARLQLFGQFRCRRLGAHEHQDSVKRFNLQNPGERVELVESADLPVALANGFRRRCTGLYGNFLRLVQVTARDTLNLFWHRCREQRHLAPFRRLIEDPLDLIDETHAQHLVSLVKHQRLQATEFERPLAHMVHHAPWCSDDNLDTAF